MRSLVVSGMGNLLKIIRRNSNNNNNNDDANANDTDYNSVLYLLPDELVYEIFLLLDIPDFIRLRCTCQYLYRIGKTDALWRSIVTQRGWHHFWNLSLLEHYREQLPLGVHEFIAISEFVSST